MKTKEKVKYWLDKYRDEKYNLKKGILQDKWRKDLGYKIELK